MIIIDRFEGDYAVCETEHGMIDIEISKLAGNVSEGDVVMFNGKNYEKDLKVSEERRRRLAEKLEKK